MSITVITASQICCKVCRTQLRNAAGDKRTNSDVMIDANKMAVPVPRGWKAQTAAYGLSW